MATPLPARTRANDTLIASTPFAQLTERQKQYAQKYGIRLQQPVQPGLPVQPPVSDGTAVQAGGPQVVPGRMFDGTPTFGGGAPVGGPNPAAGSAAEVLASIPGASTTMPSGPNEGYRTSDGQMVYVPTRPGGNGVMTNDLTPEQQGLIAGTRTWAGSPFLPQYDPDLEPQRIGTAAQVRAQQAGQAGSTGAAASSMAQGSQANRDSYARLKAVLDDFGLGSLGGSIQQWLVEGLSEAEISQRLRDTPEYQRRFPALEERRSRGLAPLSPAEYVAYEKQARQLFRAAGLPQGFYDSNEDFTKFLSGDVSLAELGDRVGLASSAAFNADSSVLSALASFGVTGGDLTAFFLDPDAAQPLLERKYNAARISATGNRAGFGYLTEQESTSLLQMGVTEGQAQQGLGELAQSKELFTALDGGEDTIGRDEQLDATFRGNANARRRIQNRTARRRAVFEQGGGFAAGQGGISGLGVDNS